MPVNLGLFILSLLLFFPFFVYWCSRIPHACHWLVHALWSSDAHVGSTGQISRADLPTKPRPHDTELAASKIDCWLQRTGAVSGSWGCSPACMIDACGPMNRGRVAMGHSASRLARASEISTQWCAFWIFFLRFWSRSRESHNDRFKIIAFESRKGLSNINNSMKFEKNWVSK